MTPLEYHEHLHREAQRLLKKPTRTLNIVHPDWYRPQHMRTFMKILRAMFCIMIVGCGSSHKTLPAEGDATSSPSDTVHSPAVTDGGGARDTEITGDGSVTVSHTDSGSDALDVTDVASDSSAEASVTEDAGDGFLRACGASIGSCAPGLTCISSADAPAIPIPNPLYHWCSRSCSSDAECPGGKCWTSAGWCYSDT